jgi:alkylhydroperoxidase/carboxymuconolactone decarboxylase family protein YurZ
MATNPPQTTDQQRDTLQHIADNDDGSIADLIEIRVAEAVNASDLDARTFALVNLGALVACGGDDSSYLLHVSAALDAGASVDEVTGVLTAVGPNVGVFKMVAAADPLATALGITLAARQADQGGGGGGAGDMGGAGAGGGTAGTGDMGGTGTGAAGGTGGAGGAGAT